MRRIALRLEYDGTAFAGSQAQPGRRTVQETLEEALREFTGEERRFAFAGRTDSGVHATGQVAAFDTEADHSPDTCRDALNHFLPEDVAVRAAAEVAPAFDPRRDATSRVYRYRLEDGRVRAPLTRRVAWQLPYRLDAGAMARAAALLPRDERDWAAFGGPVPEGYSTVRRLLGCAVQRCAPHEVVVTMEATGFLPHQVRRTVGALREVGRGRLEPEAFAALIDGPRGTAGPSAPPQGLVLADVRYPASTLRLGGAEWDDDRPDAGETETGT